ncbi:WecB/TagA/CpsF family glycosyltransferase [Rhodococcus opacus]
MSTSSIGVRLERRGVGHIPFGVTTLQGATQTVIEAAVKGVPMPIRLSNAYCVALASTDEKYRAVMNGPGVNFPDGTPIPWVMNYGTRAPALAGRVRGPSLFVEVLDAGRRSDVGHFFLGATEDTLARLVEQVSARFPGIRIAGTYSPPFSPVTEDFYAQCVSKIRQTDAQIIWVALGTPKQDVVGATIAEMAQLPTVAVGAAFDFLAGTVREAPEWVQNSGTEWLFRLATEPRRLWRRYLIGNFQFLRAAYNGRGLRNLPAIEI